MGLRLWGRARRASGAGRPPLLRGPCGLPCGARASPNPPGPALLSHAQGIAQPAPLARLGELVTVAGSQHPDFLCARLFLVAIHVNFANARCSFDAGVRQNGPHGPTVYISLNMLQTSSKESAASASILILSALGSVSLMPAGAAFFVHLVYFAVPMAIVCALAHLTSTGAGWVAGSSTAFAAVAIFETFWEQRIYTGPNSMPGFVYLFLCGPLAIVGLVIACSIRKWLKSTALRCSAAASAVFFAGALPVLGSLMASKHV